MAERFELTPVVEPQSGPVQAGPEREPWIQPVVAANPVSARCETQSRSGRAISTTRPGPAPWAITIFIN
jgi:hypothetical protein